MSSVHPRLLSVNPTPAILPLRRLPAADPHARLIDAFQVVLDQIDHCLTTTTTTRGSRRWHELQLTRSGLLAELAQAEADHVDSSTPVAWRLAQDGVGVVVVSKDGAETHLPHRTTQEMRGLGLEELGF